MGKGDNKSTGSTVTLQADAKRLADVRAYLTTVQINEKTNEQTLIIDTNAAYYQYYLKLRKLNDIANGVNNDERFNDLSVYLKEIIDLEDENEAYRNPGYTDEQVKNFVLQSETYEFDENRYLALGRELDQLNEELSKEQDILNTLEKERAKRAKAKADLEDSDFHKTKFGEKIDSILTGYVDGKLINALDVVEEQSVKNSIGDNKDDGGLKEDLNALLYCKKMMKAAYETLSVDRGSKHPEQKLMDFFTSLQGALMLPMANMGIGLDGENKLSGTDNAKESLDALIGKYDKALKTRRAKNDPVYSGSLTYLKSCYEAYKDLISQAEKLFKENDVNNYVIGGLNNEIRKKQPIIDDYEKIDKQYGDQDLKVKTCQNKVRDQNDAINNQLKEVVKSAAILKNIAEDIRTKAESKLRKIDQRQKDAEKKRRLAEEEKRRAEEEAKRKAEEEARRKAEEEARLKAEQAEKERLKRELEEKTAALEEKYPDLRKIREDRQKVNRELDLLIKKIAEKYPGAKDVEDMTLVGSGNVNGLEEKYGPEYVEDLMNFYEKRSYLSRRVQSLGKDYIKERDLLLKYEKVVADEEARRPQIEAGEYSEPEAEEKLIEDEKEGSENQFAEEELAPDQFADYKKNEEKPEISTLGYLKEMRRLAKALDATKGIGQKNTKGFTDLYDVMKGFINAKDDMLNYVAAHSSCADFVKNYKGKIDSACDRYAADHSGNDQKPAGLNKNQILRLKVMSRIKQLISFAEEKRPLYDPQVKREMLAEKYLNASYGKAYSEAKNPAEKAQAANNMLGFSAIRQASKDGVLDTKLSDLKNIKDNAELDKLLKKRAQVFLSTVEKGGLKDIAKQNGLQNAAKTAPEK